MKWYILKIMKKYGHNRIKIIINSYNRLFIDNVNKWNFIIFKLKKLRHNILLVSNSCYVNVHATVNDWKKIKSVHPKGKQSWIFTGRTDAEADASILWPPDVKNWLIGKDPDAGKDWRQEEKGMTEDEIVGWHHWLDGHEFEQAP